ncbi:MAG: hypothetical protein AB1772_06540 [Candidatus Zixiibacteriota bacterium]
MQRKTRIARLAIPVLGVIFSLEELEMSSMVSTNRVAFLNGALIFAVLSAGCQDRPTPPGPPDIGAEWRTVEFGIGNTIRGIATTDSLAVIVGDGGLIYTSDDARHWQQQRGSGPNDGLQDIVRFDSLYVAVGMNGTLITSPNARDWTYVGIEDQAHMYGIAVGDTLAVAVGAGGSIYTSDDGVEWVLNHQDPPTDFRDVARRDSTWVVCGESGTILASTDALSWEPAITTFDPAIMFPAVTVADSTFFAISVDPNADPSSRCQVLSSDDDYVWFVKANLDAWYLHDIFWTGYELVAVGEGTEYHLGFPDGLLFSSPDGLTWTPQTTAAPFALTCAGSLAGNLIVGGSSGYVLAGSSADDVEIVTSGAGITGAVWTGSKFVAVTDRGTVMQSADGITWSERHSRASVSFDRLAYGEGVYAALGGLGAPTEIYQSTDGTNWSRVLEFQEVVLKDIVFGGGLFLACGQDGAVFVSDDGQAWGRQFVGDSVTLRAVIWDGRRYLAAASDIVYTSDDGVSWTKPTIDPIAVAPVISRIVWTGSQYATVGNSEVGPNDLRGFVYTSPNAVTWQMHALGQVEQLNDIAWTRTRLVICGREGTLLSSTDADSWQVAGSGTTQHLTDIVVGGGKVIAVGGNRTVLVSP